MATDCNMIAITLTNPNVLSLQLAAQVIPIFFFFFSFSFGFWLDCVHLAPKWRSEKNTTIKSHSMT
jgi:hypothetical protein